MKKTIPILIIIIFLTTKITKYQNKETKEVNKEFRGIFISYIEIYNYLQAKY